MKSDERKSDDYWMGVRDALRMIDSFYRWSRQNPKRAKKLEDFITDGLIAAAKRCKSCFSRDLGVDYKEDEYGESLDIEESSEPTEIPVFFEESISGLAEPFVSPEKPSEIEEPPSSESVSDEEFPELFDLIDSDTPREGITRDFSSEFELIEPEPLVTKSQEPELETTSKFEVTGPPEPDLEEELSVSSEATPDISFDISKVESEDLIPKTEEPDSEVLEEDTSIEESEKLDDSPESPIESSSSIEEESILEEPESPTTTPRFSWDNHDDSTGSLSDDEIETSEPKESSFTKVRTWSPHDEPSLSESIISPDSESVSKGIEDEVEESVPDTTPSTTEEPPAPPPPPESDESEEERKRRARRLFFGT
jgi:hypothetical protein